MSIFDIFSKRGKEPSNEIFKYNDLPMVFRNQVIHIWNDSLGEYNSYYNEDRSSNRTWVFIHDALCREYGIFQLSEKGYHKDSKCKYFLQNEKSIERCLDIIELSFRVIDRAVREEKHRWRDMGIKQNPDSAIEELNKRFQEHGLGYQYIEGIIVRVDSEFIHKEAVEPAVHLLFSEGFEGASEEFFKAHEHFRKGNDKEAVTEALKAFESVMKTIFIKNKWELPPKQTAAPLILELFQKEIIPSNLQTQLTSLKTTLEGLATIRNKNTGHGQGEKSVKIPRHLVAYALHLCATNIVFLIESYKLKK